MAVTFNIGHMSTAHLIQKYPSYYRSIVSHAINDVAFQARRDLGEHAKRVFKNPRALTKNPGEVVSKSKPDTLQAKIGLRDQVAKGTAPDVYLRPQIEGGARAQKRFEKAITRRYPQFGPNTFFVPAINGTQFLDSKGQLKGSVVTQMLAHLQAFGEEGYKANIKNPKKALYFPIFKKGDFANLPPGIYKRDALGSPNFQLVVAAVKQPMYKKRFFYFERVEKTAKKVFPTSFARRFQRVSRRESATFNLTGQKLETRLQRQARMASAIASNRRVMSIRNSFGITRSQNVLQL